MSEIARLSEQYSSGTRLKPEVVRVEFRLSHDWRCEVPESGFHEVELTTGKCESLF